MTEKKEVFKCVDCGHIEERDLGFAESKDPSPEVNIMSSPPSLPPSEPVEKKEGEEKEYMDIGLHLVIGDCAECSGHSWERISFGSMEKEEPKVKRSENQEPPPTERGFEGVVPPSPEVNPADVMVTDTHTEVRYTKEEDKPRVVKDEEPQPNEKGFQDVIPPSPEVNPADVMVTDTHGEVHIAKKQSEPVTKEEQHNYKCEACGKEEKSELDKEDLGSCSVCGFNGWEKTSH